MIFFSTHEKYLKFSQNKLHPMWKKCGNFQVEVLYTFEIISIPVVLYVEKQCKCNRVCIE